MTSKTVRVLKQWDIYFFPFDRPECPHPVVIFSNDERCTRSQLPYVNGLICQTLSAPEIVYPNQIVLDEADGFKHKTACTCDYLYVLKKEALLTKIGTVSIARRRQIAQLFIGSHRLLSS